MISKRIRSDLDWTAVKGSFVVECVEGKIDPRLGVVPEREHVETLFLLHCRDLVRQVDGLPADEQPDGWTIERPDFLHPISEAGSDGVGA